MQRPEEAKARTAPPPVSNERHLQTTGLDLAITPFFAVYPREKEAFAYGQNQRRRTLDISLPDDTGGQKHSFNATTPLSRGDLADMFASDGL